jgi:perosamine synthetase
MSWFVFVVRLATGYTADERDRIIAGMRNHEVGAAELFPLHPPSGPFIARSSGMPPACSRSRNR